MIKVPHLRDFPEFGLLGVFGGNSHEEAIEAAKKWAGEVGATLSHYFCQLPTGKNSYGILVRYIKNENNNS